MPIEHKVYRPQVTATLRWVEGDTLDTARSYFTRARLGDYYYDRLTLSIEGGELVVMFSDSAWEEPFVTVVPVGSTVVYGSRTDMTVWSAATVAEQMFPAEEAPGAVIPG